MTRKAVEDFLKQKTWQLLQHIELGTIADVFVVGKEGERHVLKVPRDANADAHTLYTEHRVLQYLNVTPMQQFVPEVGEWLCSLSLTYPL